jgi:hypothetical protein
VDNIAVVAAVVDTIVAVAVAVAVAVTVAVANISVIIDRAANAKINWINRQFCADAFCRSVLRRCFSPRLFRLFRSRLAGVQEGGRVIIPSFESTVAHDELKRLLRRSCLVVSTEDIHSFKHWTTWVWLLFIRAN